jgi:hypothetical protein
MPRANRVTGLANVALLERELGGIEYQLSKAPGEAERRALKARKAGLLMALDAEHAKQPP